MASNRKEAVRNAIDHLGRHGWLSMDGRAEVTTPSGGELVINQFEKELPVEREAFLRIRMAFELIDPDPDDLIVPKDELASMVRAALQASDSSQPRLRPGQ